MNNNKKGQRFLLSLIAFIVITSSTITLGDDAGNLMPTEHHKKVSMVVSTILEKYHFRKVQINDSISSVIFDNYVNGFDPNKIYFTQADIDGFEQYRYQMDDAIKSGDLTAPFEIYNAFYKQYKYRNEYALELIQTDFDYSKDDKKEGWSLGKMFKRPVQ